MSREYNSTYKKHRQRKVWSIDTLQLRMQEAMASLEPAFNGEEGKDYDKEDIQFKAKIAHAYSQLGSKVKQTIKVRKLEDLEQEIEQLKQQIEGN